MLKKQKGNMYEFVTHMWAPIRGKCSHDCSYCYMKKWDEQPPLRLDEKDLKTHLGVDNFIFVCHTCDMFAKDVPDEWIHRVLSRCNCFKNKYLFQSKNAHRFIDYVDWFPTLSLIGTTIETNRDIVKSNAPPVQKRAAALQIVSRYHWPTMVTIEPIFDFDLEPMLDLIITARPEWVNIGADSKCHDLPEPSKEKVEELIKALRETTTVKLKGNLKRIYDK